MKADLESIMDKMINAGDDNDHRIYVMTGSDDKAGILNRIDSYKPHIITACGGDGTVNFVASIILGMKIDLGIIPLGSANGLAFELGIPGKVEEALKLVISGKARPMDVVRINEEHISLHLSDVGINARIVKEFEKEGKRGFGGYVKQFFREMLRPQKSFRCIINTGGRTIAHRAVMTLIANASFYRTGANMNPTGKIDDGKFEIIVLKPFRRWLLKSLAGAFTGTLDRKPHVETYDCTSAVINIIPPEELQIDGETLGRSNEIRARIEKHALSIILPEKT